VPFFELDGDTPARVVLEQTGATTFTIVEPFRYVDSMTHEQFVVPDPRWGDAETDLASVPSILLWFVPRYGQHTLPALLHDQLVDHDLRDHRERADRIFRDAMGEQGVRFVRRWIMWSAVSLATIVRSHRWRLALIIPWLTIFAALAFRLTPPFAAWSVWPFSALVELPWWWAAIAAGVGPLVLSVLWGRRYLAGVMSGYGAFVFAVPLTAVALALGVYWALEWVLRPLDSRKGEQRLPGEPPPARAEVREVRGRS
jgi:hypothetical protein